MSGSRVHIAVGVSLISPLNDLLAISQAMLFGRKIKETKIAKQPIFILGHWRSGTTLLHELMVTNPEFASPNTFQCFAPSHFLLSEPLMVKLGGFLLPKRRPMDNMEAGWTLPQEDEFALMNLGVPTPYLRIAFPKTQPELLEYLDLKGISEKEREHWATRFMWFLKVLTFHCDGRQLVLKSPTHTGRIRELVRLFPDAKFIHLTRDPIKLFSSTMRLWNSLEEVQALQDSPAAEEREKYVADCLNVMYEGFEQAREAVAPNNIVDVRYEDLAAEPLETMRSLYEQLSLGDFAAVEPALQTRLANHGEYQPNKHQIDAELRRKVMETWPGYARRYGYEKVPAEV